MRTLRFGRAVGTGPVELDRAQRLLDLAGIDDVSAPGCGCFGASPSCTLTCVPAGVCTSTRVPSSAILQCLTQLEHRQRLLGHDRAPTASGAAQKRVRHRHTVGVEHAHVAEIGTRNRVVHDIRQRHFDERLSGRCVDRMPRA